MRIDQAPEVVVQRRGNALWMVLSRPQAFNALTPASIALIDEALGEVEKDRSLRACVITGSGKAFCAGADLKAVLANGAAEEATQVTMRFLRQVGEVFNRLESLPVPTVAAVNGVALAGGLELLLCCDIVMASQSAVLGDGHATFGQIPGGGGTWRLPRRIGAARAKYLMFSARSLSADEAMAWSLVDEVCPALKLEDDVARLTARFERHSALVLSRMKALVDTAGRSDADTALLAELHMSEAHMASRDRNEGLAAFSEKRTPVYTGH
jgi:enoyl-CoA hydratase/carnithine racemase